MSTSLYWIRRDVRLLDNAPLSAARAATEKVYAVYCSAELESLNPRQSAFMLSALRQLRSALQKLDASLSILEGEPSEALVRAARQFAASRVYCARAFNTKERAVEQKVAQALQAASVALCVEDGNLVHEPAAVAGLKQAAGEGYRVFPPFYETWKSISVPRPLPQTAPNARDPEPGALKEPTAFSHLPVASESAALETLQRFTTARAADYSVNAEYPARNGTSSLAVYLRFGLLSPRTVYHTIAEKMARSWTLAQERMSMQVFLRRLALRDFYAHLNYYSPDMHTEALQEKMRGFPWSHDETSTKLWESGKTGYPLVDAAMRQLKLEGHVHQRAAVCAASFCACDLGLDWRIGRDIWMTHSLEADDALCDGNWQRIAGIGSDQAAYPRIYNPVRQAQLFDAQATYIRRYCRELSKLPTRAALAPWELGRQQQIELGFFTPQQYPAPIVDHDVAAREFLRKYQAYRNRET